MLPKIIRIQDNVTNIIVTQNVWIIALDSNQGKSAAQPQPQAASTTSSQPSSSISIYHEHYTAIVASVITIIALYVAMI